MARFAELSEEDDLAYLLEGEDAVNTKKLFYQYCCEIIIFVTATKFRK